MASLAETVVPALTVASATVLVYDWFCTLDEEVMFVWLAPFTWTSVLFYINRYVAIVDVVASVFMTTLTNLSVDTCKRFVPYSMYSMLFGGYIGEWILMARTYALWECRRWLLITFVVLGIAAFVPSCVLTKRFSHGLVYPELLPGITYHGCSAIPTNNSAVTVFILLLGSETIIAIFTAIKAREHLKQVHSTWVQRLYVQNGLIYYLYILAISVANVTVSLASPKDAALLIVPQRALHSIFCTHILLHIRRNRPPDDRTLFSTVGNASAEDFQNSFDHFDANYGTLESTVYHSGSIDRIPRRGHHAVGSGTTLVSDNLPVPASSSSSRRRSSLATIERQLQ